MGDRIKNKAASDVFLFIKISFKIALFFVVITALIYEFLTYSRLDIEGVAAYTRLSDFNEYLIILNILVVATFLFFAYNLSLRRPILLSLDILFLLIVGIYIALRFTVWYDVVDSTVMGYDKLLSNIRVLYYGTVAVMTIIYICILFIRGVYDYFSVSDTSGLNLREEMFKKQMLLRKMEQLTTAHQKIAVCEEEKVSEEDYRRVVRDVFKDKAKLHENY